MRTRVITPIVLFTLVLVIFASVASAANCTVTTASDHVDQSCNGDCSLREAVLEPSCTTITFSLDLAGTPVVLTLGELVISHSVSITGWGADAITISGNDTSRIFYVPAGSTLNLAGVTLRDGNGMGTLPANGGAIRSIGPVNLDGVYIRSNQAPGNGAAISYEGSADKTIRNSTISFNLSSLDVPANSAIYNGSSSGAVQIFNSSLYGNTGTALFNFGQQMLLINSTVAFNGAKGIYVNGNAFVTFANSITMRLYRSNNFAGVATLGNNAVNVAGGSMGITFMASDLLTDPTLDTPKFNGGHVPTMALLPGSPAIDAGSNERSNQFFLTTDQRGFDRFVPFTPGGHPITDIGAYEFNATAPAPVTVAGRVLGAVSGNPLRSQTVTITDMQGNTVRTALSSSLGWVVFDNLPAGFVYRLSVNARRGAVQKTVFADQNLSDADILIPGL